MLLQVYAMPVYDMIEYQLVKHRVPNGFVTRLVYRTIYIVLVAFVAITLPFFGGENRFLCVVYAPGVCLTCTPALTDSCCNVSLHAGDCHVRLFLLHVLVPAVTLVTHPQTSWFANSIAQLQR